MNKKSLSNDLSLVKFNNPEYVNLITDDLFDILLKSLSDYEKKVVHYTINYCQLLIHFRKNLLTLFDLTNPKFSTDLNNLYILHNSWKLNETSEISVDLENIYKFFGGDINQNTLEYKYELLIKYNDLIKEINKISESESDSEQDKYLNNLLS